MADPIVQTDHWTDAVKRASLVDVIVDGFEGWPGCAEVQHGYRMRHLPCPTTELADQKWVQFLGEAAKLWGWSQVMTLRDPPSRTMGPAGHIVTTDVQWLDGPRLILEGKHILILVRHPGFGVWWHQLMAADWADMHRAEARFRASPHMPPRSNFGGFNG